MTPECRYGFPQALATWLGRNGDLIDALLALRRVETEGTEAVSAVLRVRRVAEVRASWELWEALVEGDGGDPELGLLDEVSQPLLQRARHALWGRACGEDDDAQADRHVGPRRCVSEPWYRSQSSRR